MISTPRASTTTVWTYRVVLVLAGSLLMYAGAKFKIEVGAVPITGQTLAVPILVALLGTRLALAAIAAYLLEGALGLPVFARGGGLAYLLGPTAGYLWSMPLGAYLIGTLYDQGFDRNFPRRFVAVFAGTSLVILIGALWLKVLTGSAAAAFAMGIAPFLIGDFIKVALAAAVPAHVWPRIAAKRGF